MGEGHAAGGGRTGGTAEAKVKLQVGMVLKMCGATGTGGNGVGPEEGALWPRVRHTYT